MLKIGDFSKVCQVSVKALRYWDEQDLLKPAQTDPATGYRYYTIEQISEVNRILAFRTMGLELKQIRALLADNLTTQDIRAMLRLKQVELQQQLEQAAATLTMIEARLQQIDYAGQLPDYEVSLKPAAPQTILALREAVPTLQVLVNLLRETHAYALGTQLLAVFHDYAYQEEVMDVEIGFASESLKPLALAQGRVMRETQLPGVDLLATTIHHGTWNSLSNGYVHLGQWIERHSYQISGPGREIFHRIDWDTDHQTTVTELQFPIRRHHAQQ